MKRSYDFAMDINFPNEFSCHVIKKNILRFCTFLVLLNQGNFLFVIFGLGRGPMGVGREGTSSPLEINSGKLEIIWALNFLFFLLSDWTQIDHTITVICFENWL